MPSNIKLGPSRHPIQAELDRLGFPRRHRILNPTPEQGMFGSIQCAARWPGWRRDLTHWAIVLGDQPHLHHYTLRQVLQFSAAHPSRIAQPARRGHGRHPVFVPRSVLAELAASRATSLKSFLTARASRVTRCELDDPGLDLDIDRLADYKRAMRFARRHARAGKPSQGVL